MRFQYIWKRRNPAVPVMEYWHGAAVREWRTDRAASPARVGSSRSRELRDRAFTAPDLDNTGLVRAYSPMR